MQSCVRSSRSTSARTRASTGYGRFRTSGPGRRRTRIRGLLVIGIHTPEFSFEKDIDNIRRALADMRVGYPIAIDSDYGVWNAFANHY
jgi:hypothetical protein